MAAVTSAVIAIVGLVLGWIAIEVACKPCLEKGREAIDRSLDPNYDPDDNEGNAAPLIRHVSCSSRSSPGLLHAGSPAKSGVRGRPAASARSPSTGGAPGFLTGAGSRHVAVQQSCYPENIINKSINTSLISKRLRTPGPENNLNKIYITFIKAAYIIRWTGEMSKLINEEIYRA
ncbi:hypothetical protein H6P81_004787 [Aristolochia fimbriata]|uniref:Uncharacterized protein n=1 Tax=Aristolochia fimbriata TaxID=158543 RepID=A0AAV7ESR1_ARIFI|nr:hypothetical protein H6P81_004787 [Aristolochia fimbriata]